MDLNFSKTIVNYYNKVFIQKEKKMNINDTSKKFTNRDITHEYQ